MSEHSDRRKASRKGQLDTSLPATLRRRASDLAGEYNEQWLRPLLAAADRLAVLERYVAGTDDSYIIDLVDDARQLRKAILAVMNRIRVLPIEKQLRKSLLEQLFAPVNARTEMGGEVIIARVAVGHVRSGLIDRAAVEAQFTVLLDQLYTPPPTEAGNGEEGSKGESQATEEPEAKEPAGHDAPE